MSLPRFILHASLVATGLCLSLQVAAHAALLQAVPAEAATVAAPAQIKLDFSETLLAPLSGAELVLSEMPGMTMEPQKVPVKVSFSADAKTLYVTPMRHLITGTYQLDWHVVSADTHPRKGILSFKVK